MRKELKNMPLYVSADSKYLNLATNENYCIKWNKIMSTIINESINEFEFHKYGDSNYTQLVSQYSKYVSISSEYIICESSSDRLIPLVINSLTTKNFVTLKPDFFRYNQVGLIHNREIFHVDFDENYIENAIKLINENSIEMIILSNPNNPLGVLHDNDAIIRVLNETSAYVVVDEAYMEFCNKSIISEVVNHSKLIVLRTLSKGFGLASLRVGFLISNPEIIEYLKPIQGPFFMSSLIANIATIALKNVDNVISSVNTVIDNKNEFIQFLSNYNIEYIYPSASNFVAIRDINVNKMYDELKNRNILVSIYDDNILRFTIGDKYQMGALMDALKIIFKELEI